VAAAAARLSDGHRVMAAQRESGDNGVTSPWQRQLTTAVTCHRSASGYSNVLGTEGKRQLTSDGNSVKIRAVVNQWQWHCSTVPAAVDNTQLQQQAVTATCWGWGWKQARHFRGCKPTLFESDSAVVELKPNLDNNEKTTQQCFVAKTIFGKQPLSGSSCSK